MMAQDRAEIFGGVDTHKQVHVAAAIDGAGRLLGTAEFAADADGCRGLLGWLESFGTLVRVGVEGTGSYGAGLTRHLASAGAQVVEVNRQNWRRRGKTDAVDAEAAARAVLSGEATTAPKSADGRAEAIRALSVARRSAVKARTVAANQIDALIVTAPEDLRRQPRRSVIGPQHPPPAEPRRQPASQQRPVAHRHGPPPRRPAHHRLRSKAQRRRQDPTRDRALHQAAHRPRDPPTAHRPTPGAPPRRPPPTPAQSRHHRHRNSTRPRRRTSTHHSTRNRPKPQQPARRALPPAPHPNRHLTNIGASTCSRSCAPKPTASPTTPTSKPAASSPHNLTPPNPAAPSQKKTKAQSLSYDIGELLSTSREFTCSIVCVNQGYAVGRVSWPPCTEGSWHHCLRVILRGLRSWCPSSRISTSKTSSRCCLGLSRQDSLAGSRSWSI